MARVGLSRSVFETPKEWLRACEQAGGLGLSAHSADLPGRDAFVDASTSVLAGVPSNVIAVALPVRSPLQTALAIATLAGLGEGRLRTGFGAGNRRSLEKGHGTNYDSAASSLIDYVSAIKVVLHAPAGAPVSHDGAFHRVSSTGLGFDETSAPLILGAHGPRLADFAAEQTQGLVTHLFTAETVGRRLLDRARGRRAAALIKEPFWTARGVLTSVHAEEQLALAHARWEVAAGLRVWGSRLAEVAPPELCEAVDDHLARHAYAELAAMLPEDLVRQFVLVGTVDDLRRHIDADDSADEIVPVPVGTFYADIAAAFGAAQGDPADDRRRLGEALLTPL